MSTPSDFPVRTREYSLEVAGSQCSVIASLYADRLLVIATQLPTLGTIVHAQKESVLGGGATFTVATLLGDRSDPLPELCARRLVEGLCAAGCDRPVVLCLGLRRKQVETGSRAQGELLRSLVNGILANPLW
jgi:proteasome assembly chaperone 3